LRSFLSWDVGRCRTSVFGFKAVSAVVGCDFLEIFSGALIHQAPGGVLFAVNNLRAGMAVSLILLANLICSPVAHKAFSVDKVCNIKDYAISRILL
jgi:hypothetical protein